MQIFTFLKEFGLFSLHLFSIISEIVMILVIPTLLFLNPWIILGYQINLFDKLEIFKNYEGISPFIGAFISSVLIYIFYKIYDRIYSKKVD